MIVVQRILGLDKQRRQNKKKESGKRRLTLNLGMEKSQKEHLKIYLLHFRYPQKLF